MTLYRFKTFRTSYFFPRMTRELEYMYELYAAYGGKLSRAYWWLFRNCGVVRWLNKVDSDKVNFPYQQIAELEGNASLMAFNLGTPGAEQKISILGYDSQSKERFFAKYSEKEKAMELTRNEIRVYRLLGVTGLTPTLFDAKEADGYVWMKTSCVNGRHYPSMELTAEIVDLALQLGKYHLAESDAVDDGLKTCLSHGDFCPWNMLSDGEKLRLIDWEMAAERPLGYDIFKYVCQCARLFAPERKYEEVIAENAALISRYFSALCVDDWQPYAQDFLSSDRWN